MTNTDESTLLRVLRGTALLLGLFAGRHHARAATCDINYTGLSNGAWDVAGNWTPNGPPTSAQNVCIPSGKGTITVGNGVTAAALTVTALSGIQVADGGQLDMFDAGAGFNNTFTDVTIDGPTGIFGTIGGGTAFTGTVVVDGRLQARARLDSGILSGSGQVSGSLTNVAGTVRPGGAGAVGTLTLGGDYVQQAGAALELDLASDSSYDKITAPSSNHTIAGSITVSTIGGYTPVNGTDFFFFTQNANSIAITATVTPSTYVLTVLLHGAKLTFNPTTTTIATTTTTTTSTAPSSTTTTTTTTSTTIVSTTTTTTTSTSTTQAAPTTTSTTVPSGCDGPRAATFTSIDCRLDALIADVTAASDVPSKLKTVFLKQLNAARAKKQSAEQLSATAPSKKALKALKASRRKAIGFSHRVGSLNSRHQMPMDTITRLKTPGDEISSDLQSLRDLCTRSTAPECGAP